MEGAVISGPLLQGDPLGELTGVRFSPLPVFPFMETSFLFLVEFLC